MFKLMGIPVKLKDIVEEMGTQFDDSYLFLNKTTGEIVYVTSEELRAAEEEEESYDDIPQWMLESRSTAIDILENHSNYVELPTKFDIHEYRIIEDFCFSISDEEVRDSLFNAIKRKGAFRRFKDQIMYFGIAEQWYSYRDERFKQIAKRWCQDYDIEFIE